MKTNHTFGITGYRVPIVTYGKPKTKLGRIDAEKKKTYLDQMLKEKKRIPDSVKYSKLRNWTANMRGKFAREKKVTLMAEIVKRYKKTPGPMTYKPKENSIGSKKIKTQPDKIPRNQRMNEIEFLAKQTPGVSKYNTEKSLRSID